MKNVVAVIAPGAMGSAIAKRLNDNGATVLTSLKNRSDAARKRALDSGMQDADDIDIASADYVLSVVPPSEALGLAQRLAPHFERATRKALFIDCNAISPQSVTAVSQVITNAGARFVDGCIIGLPPVQGEPGPALYISGPHAQDAMPLAQLGMDMRFLDGAIGAASALKMSYAGITKGLTGIAAAMILAATRAGAAPALREELEKSQPALLKRFSTGLPDMFPKAYRWVAEMREIAAFAESGSGASEVYEGLALLYEALAEDVENDRALIDSLNAFLEPPRSSDK